MGVWHLPRTSVYGTASQALSSAWYVTDTYTEHMVVVVVVDFIIRKRP